jgi:hypothetical protein
MTYHPAASRVFSYPTDRFGALDPLDRAPVAATAEAWHQLRALADTGHPLAKRIVGIGRATNAKKLAVAEGTPIPAWAQEILAPIEDDDGTNVDEALALLNAAL